MDREDRTLTCMDCSKDFVFTAGEQDFYAEKGFANDPKRCPECRRQKKTARRERERVSVEATCDSCGKSCTIPFQPTQGRPVYCDDCFAQMKESSGQEAE